jgi:Family of unknown function (DUF6174)
VPRAASALVPVLAFALLATGCRAAGETPSPSEPSPSSTSSPSPTTSAPADPAAASPDRRALEEATALWEGMAPTTHAYTLAFSSYLTNFETRVVQLEGDEDAVMSHDTWISDEPVGPEETVAGLFEAVDGALDGEGTFEVSYDPVFGYPARMDYANPRVYDADWARQITAFRAGQAVATGDADATRMALGEARARWSPLGDVIDYEYTWSRRAAGGGSDTARVDVDRIDGRTRVLRGGVPAGDDPGEASVEATFDDIEEALDAGWWVEAVFDARVGVPVLVAVDRSPADGDATWTRIAFRDLEAHGAAAARDAARETWSRTRPHRYRYVWRFRSDDANWRYRVTMTGDVADIDGSRDAPMGESAPIAPRIDELFTFMELVESEGTRVVAQYDAEQGFPTRVVLTHNFWIDRGTITIEDFEVLDP